MTDITKVLYCFGCEVSKGLQLFSAKQRESTRPVCMSCISTVNKRRRIRSVGSNNKKYAWRSTMGVHFLRSSQ